MMIENLESRGCQLLGFLDYPTLESQIKRMLDVFAIPEDQSSPQKKVKAECLPMNRLYSERLNTEGEKTRIEKIELFDEFEEWELL